MITCPWCGTSYMTFQSNCQNCGGTMPIPTDSTLVVSLSENDVLMPPLAPRAIAASYTWRLLLTDGWAIAALVFILLGAIFTLVGLVLTLGVITAFVGIPFVGLGLFFLVAGIAVAIWRYQAAQKIVEVLRVGVAVEGQIAQIEQNWQVRINGRYPWVIRYTFRVAGQTYEGRVSTLNLPGARFQSGRRVCVLYLTNAPGQNVLYPHP